MKIKFAILGCGHIGKRHAELVLLHPDAELMATIDSVDPLSLGIKDFTAPHFYSLEDFLNANLDVDVVNICTPNGLHAEHAVKCLVDHKHVVVEKPIALNKEDAEAISQAATACGKYVFPVVQNRYSPTIKWLKEIVSKGTLGEVFMVQLNCFWNRDESYYTRGSWHGTLALDGGPLFTQFSHFIDVLNWIFGGIANINAKFLNFSHQKNIEFEDTGMVTFDLITGGTGSINYSTSVYQSNFESSITVIAQNGTIKIGGQYMNSLEYCHIKGTDKPIFSEEQLMNNYGNYMGSASNHHLVIDNVVKVLNGIDEPHVYLAEGLEVVNLIDQIYADRTSSKKEQKTK